MLDGKIKRIYSDTYNQFYKPIWIDNDVGICYMQVGKNKHDKEIKPKEIAHIEQNTDYRYVVMHDANITAENNFIKVMSGNRDYKVKHSELEWFKRNMLMESEVAIKKLKEIAENKCNPESETFTDDVEVHNHALELYSTLYRRKIIKDNRETYIAQNIPNDIQKIAIEKRLFIQRSDDYCGKKPNRHLSTQNDRNMLQGKYPCGFLIRNRGGIVVAGGCFELTKEGIVDFVKNYQPTGREKYYTRLYYVPMSLKKKKQLALCSSILQSYGLHYKNEHNSFFWVLDKNKRVIAGGKNGFGFKWLLKYCRRLRQNPKFKK